MPAAADCFCDCNLTAEAVVNPPPRETVCGCRTPPDGGSLLDSYTVTFLASAVIGCGIRLVIMLILLFFATGSASFFIYSAAAGAHATTEFFFF